MDHYKSVHPLKYFRDHLAHKIRPDGRGINKFRNVVLNLNSIRTADGSSVVRVGNTCVVCGVKAEVGPPRAEEPRNGFLIINVELPPLCSSQFRPGPPSEKAQTLSAFVNDVASQSGIVNLESLCIEADKLVWSLYCDIVCLNYDGATEDACFASLIGALLTVTLPKVEYNVDTGVITVDDEIRNPINVLCKPIATSFAIIDDNTIIVDPCSEEESLSTGIFTIVIADNKLCSVHKPGGEPLSEEQMNKCIEEAKERTRLIYDLIENASMDSHT